MLQNIAVGNNAAKVRLLQIVTLSSWGGAPQVVYDLIKSANRDRFTISLACGSGDGWERMKELGVPIVPVTCLKRNISVVDDIMALFQLYSVMKKGQYDVVHCHSSKAGFLGRIAAKLAGVKKIYFTAHGWSFYNHEEYGWAQQLIILLERIAAKCSTKIICVSEKTREDAIARKIARPEKFLVVKNGIDWNVNGDRAHIRGDLGIDKGATVFGMVGRLAHPKDPLMFLTAAKELNSNCPQVRFVLVGGGPLFKDCAHFVKENRLTETVLLLGEKSPKETRQIISSLDVFILTSRFEGLPLTIIEAMFAGLPIIASNVGGIPELVADGRNGFLVTPGNSTQLTEKMRILAETSDLRNEMGKNSREIAKRDFSLRRMTNGYEQIYLS